MNKRVLAVDDNDDMLTIVEFAFAHEGYEFASAHSHADMTAQLSGPLPDLIIVDLMLPGVNGYQLIEQLQDDARTRDIPVIVVTAKTERIYCRISEDLGAARHFIKPFHPDELVIEAGLILGAHEAVASGVTAAQQ